jgi:hypothetical protein
MCAINLIEGANHETIPPVSGRSTAERRLIEITPLSRRETGPAPVGARGRPPSQMSQELSWGLDRVLNIQSCFGVVFMKPQPRVEFGSYKAFGHDRAGGALAFADPMHDMAFGYIPMPMQFPGGADDKSIELSQIARRCIRRLC